MSEPVYLSDELQVVSLAPHVIGYQPNHDQVAVLGLNMRDGAIAAAVVQPEHGIAVSSDAAKYAGHVTDRFAAGGFDDVHIVIGYGPAAREHATIWSDALRVVVADHTQIAAVAVNQGEVSQRDLIRGWTDPVTLPSVDAEVAFSGLSAAGSTRGHDDWLRTFDPDPVASWSPLPPAELDQLQTMAPQTRAETVRTLVEALASGTSDDVARDRATLAAQMEVASAYRDVAIEHSARSASAAEAMLDAYRSAPEQYRSVLAAAAAGAHILSGHATTGSLRTLDHVGNDSQHTNVRDLLRQVAAVGVNPAESRSLLDQMQKATAGIIQEKQDIWRATQLRSASYPHPAQATTGVQLPGHAGTSPHQHRGPGLER